MGFEHNANYHQDLTQLVHGSTAAIIGFEFEFPIAVSEDPRNVLNDLLGIGSRCTLANAASKQLLALYNIEAEIERPFSAIFSPGSPLWKIIESWCLEGRPSTSFEECVVSSDGLTCRDLQAVLYASYKNSAIERIWIVLRDITEQLRARTAIESAELFYRSALEHAGLILLRVDALGAVVSCSRSVERFLGSVPAPGTRLLPELQKQLPISDLQILSRLENDLRSGVRDDFELSLKAPDGSYRWYHLKVVSYLGARGGVEYTDLIALDIDNRKRFEIEMQRMQRVELIGELAAGLAHDFKNQLGLIMAELDLLEPAAQAAGKDFQNHLEGARDAVRTSAEMAQSVLQLGRGGPERSIQDIRALSKKSVDLLRHVIPSEISLELELATEHAYTSVNSTELHQILMNLILNARDAIGTAGKISVKVASCVRRGARWIELVVVDSGAGIPREQLERIFDPFFTTKENSSKSGAGLGLSMVASIIRDLEGEVRVQSQPGHGTSFSIWLPLIEPHEPKERSLIKLDQRPINILLADDDDPVRQLLEQTLTLHGFSVLCARDGREALTIFHHHIDQIGAVVLDETMPNLCGTEVAANILQERPEMRVVVTSGYAEQRKPGDPKNLRFLGKPFSIDQLVGVLREA